MKKIIVIAFVLVTGVINAQVTFKPGLRAGAALSTFSNTNSSYKTDFYVGAFGEINLTKVYSLQPEITYTQQGSDNIKIIRDYDGENYVLESRDLEIDYLSVAMINKFTFNQGFQLQVGPTLDFRVQDNLKYLDSDVDLAFVLGLAYRISPDLTFEARFKKGLVDVLESDYYSSGGYNDDYWLDDYNTNIGFQIGLAYSFGGKK
ncbi:outer membrane beta-barrel protein [Flavobacterium sp. GA093]|uniref:Outer membrane beta-barrel protein n=1 Tax=Flavobacterium hydrocarbonoxydans TaxID=2683249 RepID=A0A6I4NI60_9FLAO|nr:outer membrane beta-barrel protein [Flavobacterium hydrocarbonoxydans]MWB93861.1 outer membrane beta-barrel protein [Flavobacterium hydrocarbonoxydans]